MSLMDNAHALIVGIADYQQINKLPRVRDAHEVALLLVDPIHCGYCPENVMTLLDGDASQAAIRHGLSTLADRCNKDSTALIYFSGHGGQIESGSHAGEYLLPVDTIYPGDEELARTAIAGDEFTGALKKIEARKILVIFDCCHSGGIGQPRDLGASPVSPGLSNDYYDRLKAGRGRVILASSRPDEFSYVMAGAEYGLFTEHLLGGLQGGVASNDGLVRIFDLFEYLQPRVTAAHPRQHPLFKGELEENFPVAMYRGGAKGVVPTVEGDFRYDAFISYIDRGADAEFVWDTLVPKLEGAGLKVAVSGDSVTPGVPRVVGGERAIRQAKRTVVVLSEEYLADSMADFENVLGQTMSIQEGTYRLLPVKISPIAEGRLPVRLSMLETLDLTHPRRAERNYERLIQTLKGSLPTR
jgi:Caspase domain/TIR domain